MNFSVGRQLPPSILAGVLLLCIGVLAGCSRDDIEVYSVRKPETPAGTAAGMGQGMQGKAAAGEQATPAIKYTTPAGWEEVAPGEMRVASFKVKGEQVKQADVGVFPLPGMAGSDLSNVNRWRGQVGLPPVTEEQLGKLAEPLQIAGESAQLYDMAGENAGSGEKSRILAAIQRREGTAWFYKMTGDDELVGKQKPNFVAFLKSVTFAAPSTEGLPPSHPPITGAAGQELPPSHPAIDAAMAQNAGARTATGAGNSGKPSWEVPSGWKEVPGGQFLIAKFQVAGADSSQATVNVSMSAGEGGGLLGNVNRWRGQLGLSPLAEADVNKLVTTVDTTGGKAMFVDMAGTDTKTGQKTRLVGAMVPQAGQTWFYKLMGNDQLVEKEKSSFTQFVQSAKY